MSHHLHESTRLSSVTYHHGYRRVHHSLLIHLSQKKNFIRSTNCVSLSVHLLTLFTRNARLAVTSNSCPCDNACAKLPLQLHTIVTVPHINFVTLEVTATFYEFRLFKNANTAMAILPKYGVSMYGPQLSNLHKIRWLLHVSVYDHHQGACN